VAEKFLEKENEMKARSKKFLGSAVVAAAMAAMAAPSAHGQAKIIYQLSAGATTSVDSSTGGSVTFDVLALVTGTNLSNTGLVQGEFSLIQTPGGISSGVLDFTLSGNYSQTGTHNANSFVFGSVPGGTAGAPASGTSTAGGSLGTGVNSTGSANDTIIGITGINGSSVNTSAPTPIGTQVVGTTTYNVFDLGTGHLTVSGASTTGATTSISIAPRGGLGNLIKPQVAIIDGTLAQFRGDDTANVSSGTPLTITSASTAVRYPGDANNDGFVDSTDFGILVGHYLTSTANGPNDADFDTSGFVDSTDFGILVGHYLTGPNPPPPAVLEAQPSLAALVSAVPEPTSLSILLAAPLLMARRRRTN